MSIYDIEIQLANGTYSTLEPYKDKVLLIVNTATECGFTSQYAGLQKLYEKYQEKGFEILDFPCNQFGNQAPGTADEIHTFCTGRFGITFPQFAKIDVNGEQESPLYHYLKAQKKGLFNSAIKWNFTKFLVDRQGNIVNRFASKDTPESLEKDILELL
ncbi:glutathione peroxidase [Enterococcus sp. PF1-24]|uniref:glutathione peroxidase n=1 Tax=unclassified Enterococcus TaxID=2608891 RepID=UPI00247614F6|nr:MULTISPECIES: glutathione peroxidase [unclassified Enterococcus]MDH6363461.1 glutathione peroxidase [Enterococcus sp. PFB1-1]MDH6400555.1 glutathione peroxidase [Enterococcus sp. PF1-24]